jgi:hypothetical protein
MRRRSGSFAGMTGRAAVRWLVLFLAVLAFGDAHANMAKWWREGELHGPLVPQDDSAIRVDSEELSFVVAPSLDSAEVTATYRMTNGGAADANAQVAFVVAAAEYAKAGGAADASVTIDGQPVAGVLYTEGELLRPKLAAWLASRPDLEKEVARLAALPRGAEYSDLQRLRELVPDCRSSCSSLVDWYKEQGDLGLARRAAEDAIPNEILVVQRGWTKRADSGPISWFTFPLSIGAGATRNVRVKYNHVAGSDSRQAVNEVFSYVYFLSPAKRWARFGDLHIEVRLPPDTELRQSSVPLTADGATYRANLPTLPNGELSFELMSRRGLLFGMSQPTGYWILLIAVMSLVTIPASARLGRLWSGGRWRVALGCIFGTGFCAFVWCIALALGLSAVLPAHAFGNPYSAMFGFFWLLVLFVVSAIVISFAATRAKSAKAATPDEERGL